MVSLKFPCITLSKIPNFLWRQRVLHSLTLPQLHSFWCVLWGSTPLCSLNTSPGTKGLIILTPTLDFFGTTSLNQTPVHWRQPWGNPLPTFFLRCFLGGYSSSVRFISNFRYPFHIRTPLTRAGLSPSSNFFSLPSIYANLSCSTCILHPSLSLRGLQLYNFRCKPFKRWFISRYFISVYDRKPFIDSILSLSIYDFHFASISNNFSIIRMNLSHISCDTKSYIPYVVCGTVLTYGPVSCDFSWTLLESYWTPNH